MVARHTQPLSRVLNRREIAFEFVVERYQQFKFEFIGVLRHMNPREDAGV